jgi:membrane-associated protein
MFDFILHIDDHLIALFTQYGMWIYGLLFSIIFCETGLVILPFLPGDSLLFATGALAARTSDALNIHLLFLLLAVASITGNTVNYLIGRWVGPAVFRSNQSLFFNKHHLEKAHQFFEEYGGKAIIIGRFLPILRTFVPFIAGMGYMSHSRFFLYNVVGAVIWIGSFLYVSYLFGNIPLIKNNFSLFVLAIIVASLLPPIIEMLRHRRKKLR